MIHQKLKKEIEPFIPQASLRVFWLSIITMMAREESPRQFKMSKQLDEGKFGEDLARKFLNDPIIKVNHGISHYDDVTQDKLFFKKGGKQ